MEQAPRIAFGIGCFHFGYHPVAGESATGQDYVVALESALREITNIEGFEVGADDDFGSIKFAPEDRTCTLDEGIHFFPGPQSDLRVHMKLFIPARIQVELGRRLALPATCERFLIDITYPFHFPMTTVRAVGPPADFEPSDGVFLARKFLESCDSLKGDKVIRFESLGPSPFHSNFYLIPVADLTKTTMTCRREPELGYDSYFFGYAECVFPDVEDAFEEFLLQFDGQIGLFYQMTHLRVMRDREWADLSSRVQSILEQSKRKGLRAWWCNTFRRADSLNDAMVELAQIEAFDIGTRYRLKKELQDLYMGDHAPELLPHLDLAMADFAIIPFVQMKEVLQLLDQRRANRLNLIMMALSVVLGGVGGACVSFVLSM